MVGGGGDLEGGGIPGCFASCFVAMWNQSFKGGFHVATKFSK